MKQIIIAAMSLAWAGMAYADGEAVYSNHRGTDTYSWWGSNQAETYDVAVKIDAPEFVGLDISAVTFHVADDANITDFSIWASRELNLDNKVNAPDLFSQPVEQTAGEITLSLDAPCHIGEEGLYLGYSFTVNAVESNTQKKPVAVIKNDSALGYNFYLHTSKIYGKWIDNGTKSNMLLPFEVTLTNVAGECVTLSLPENVYGAVGDAIPVTATVTNLGWEEVTSATISYETPAGNGNVTVECSGLPKSVFMESTTVNFELPAIDRLMEGDLKLAVTEVNGKPNSASNETVTSSMEILSRLPERTPLLEEYTGTGCGWCPRGAVGMEKMAELYPDRFVGVAYHCDDVMSILGDKEYPNPAPAQPVAWIDRIKETDPYLGDIPLDTPALGIDKVWDSMSRRFTPADISLKCSWEDDSKTVVNVESTVNFVKSFSQSDFRMVYILVEDGLTGESSQWNQGNYYSGQTDQWPSDLEFLVNAPNPIKDYVYNDVAVLTTDPKGIEGSLPAEIEADNSYSHTIALRLDDAVSLSGKNLVQDSGKLSVVAIVVDATTGEVVNCAEGKPGDSSVTEISDETSVMTEYYNLQGVRIANPKNGDVVIKVSIGSNGNKVAEKVIF